MGYLTSLNPSNNKEIGKVKISDLSEIRKKIKKARVAANGWQDIGVEGRVTKLRKIIPNFKKYGNELAKMASQEMGMPISQSVSDVHGAIEYFEWYLANAVKYLSPEIVYKDSKVIHTVYYEPVGVVAAITPWNFPPSNFVWMVGQNLVVGNTVVFKHSEEVPLCGQIIEKILSESKLPDGVFSEVYGDGKVGNLLVHQDIDMICFTGSTEVGQKLYRVAAEKFVRVFLELGGSAPGIVFADVDLKKVLPTIYSNRFDNCGQICDGLKRLIVHESVFDKVLVELTNLLSGKVVGDPMKKETAIGPLITAKQLEFLESQVKDALSKGAKIVVGGERVGKVGNYYKPTLLTNVKKDMRVWKEEVFGPVLPIVKFRTEQEAVDLANATVYGLGSYVFTEDKQKYLRVASKIKTGMVQFNTASYVVPPSPFGGCKLSGLGREHGKFGFYELSNIKLVTSEK